MTKIKKFQEPDNRISRVRKKWRERKLKRLLKRKQKLEEEAYKASLKLYDKIDTYGYEHYIKRVTNALKDGSSPDEYIIANSPDANKNIYVYSGKRDPFWAYTLGIKPEDYHTNFDGEVTRFSNSLYRPSMGGSNKSYFKIDNLPQEYISRLVKEASLLPMGTNLVIQDNVVHREYGYEPDNLTDYFGNYILGHGTDENGEYVSYLDSWDFKDPLKLFDIDKILGLNTPRFYNRYYLFPKGSIKKPNEEFSNDDNAEELNEVVVRSRNPFYIPSWNVTPFDKK